MTTYNPKEIESKWQSFWSKEKTFSVKEDPNKKKYYVLDMFPYPSGEGLHVGHPLGYIASDIIARFKKHQGYNVLHPMGYDSFGLPAEQYAIQTGQHPALTTEKNINRYRQQLNRLGFAFDWDREIRTSDPSYYKWTQWIFLQLFDSWYDLAENKAKPISILISQFEKQGTQNLMASGTKVLSFSSKQWNAYSPEKKEKVLMNYRLAYLSMSLVNWCPELGTVLANDEVKDGVSERGGYPVEQKEMMQWSLRITSYAQRLLDDLEYVDFTPSLKEQQRNWIGRSEGLLIDFDVEGHQKNIQVFTTRPDTIYGVSFMTLAPEHHIVQQITTDKYKSEVLSYLDTISKKNERERQSNAGNSTGVFTGAYALNPINNEKIPIWISEYVLHGYGTGAVMAVPAGDQRDYDFAKQFKIEIKNIFKGVSLDFSAYVEKDIEYINSPEIEGLNYHDATDAVTAILIQKKKATKKINFRLRDAIFSRQRYWGEPFPVYYKNNIPHPIKDIQVLLPKVDKYLPTKDGRPPLGRAGREDWNVFLGDQMELNTMPGWAGSSWYFLRYMDPKNESKLADPDKLKYWNQVDLYVGGAEHAVGHLLYSRFWTKFLYDLDIISFQEPYKKLLNQGMIGGAIESLCLKKDRKEGRPVFICSTQIDKSHIIKIPCHIDFVSDYGSKNSYLSPNQIGEFTKWRPEYKNALFEINNQQYTVSDLIKNPSLKIHTLTEHGKMSKRYYNTIDPEKICDLYGADTLRCYEMFLGPIEEHKPWNVNGISGVFSFLKKSWALFHQAKQAEQTKEELKTLHKTIKKVTEDIENHSFNTVISTFMIAVNEWNKLPQISLKTMEYFTVLLSPFAPHISEEFWKKLGNESTVSLAPWPSFDESFLEESSYEYPISFNGKMRFKLPLPLSLTQLEVEKEVLKNEKTQQHLAEKNVKRVIVVPGKIVNIVV